MSGIGRYLENILIFLDYDNIEYILFGKKEKIEKYNKADHIYTNESPFSRKGLFDKVFKKTKQMNLFD